jgi:hypothetical protein
MSGTSENQSSPSLGLRRILENFPAKLMNHRLISGSSVRERKVSLLSGRLSKDFLSHTHRAFYSRFVFFLERKSTETVKFCRRKFDLYLQQ